MSRLAQIRSIVQEAKELAQEVGRDLGESVEEYNLALKEFESVQESIKLATVDELKEALAGLPKEEIYEPEIVEEGEVLSELPEPQILEVEEPKEGLFRAKFLGFLSALVVFAASVLGGAVLKNIDLTQLQSSNLRESLEGVFSFYSSLITGSPHAGAAIGSVVIIALSLLVGYLVYLFLASGAAKSNLEIAKGMLNNVKEWSEEQRSFIEKLKNLTSYLHQSLQNMRGAKVFGEEFAARVKRARFFEGDEIEQMSDMARGEIEHAHKLLQTLASVAALKLYAKDWELSEHVKEQLEETGRFVEELKAQIYG